MDRQPLKQRRLPKNYALLLDIVRAQGRGTHRTANDIYATARERHGAIGFATVHRGLARLCALGEIAKIEIAGGEAAWYEPPAPEHAHLLCATCGRVVDVDFALPQPTVRAIAERQGLRIESQSLTFQGACRDCARSVRRARPT